MLKQSQFSFSPTSFDSNTSLPTTRSNSSSIAQSETQTVLCQKPSVSQNPSLSESSTWPFGGSKGSRSFMPGWDCSLRSFTLPLIFPGDPINDMVISFRDGARDLLKSGVSLDSVMGTGLTDVELLFRLRQPDDEWNVSGWACEVRSTEWEPIH